ncbi:MAG: DUF1934 domain-containing protein, partial [Clostridia bacterium]|nr:DUF1934 domain-containing protein [Clostridia bacterium]
VILNNGKQDGYFTAKGELNFGEAGFELFYDLDGDKCTLSYKNGEIVQERRGSVPILMRFKEGQETACILQMGASSGSFSVFTNKIQIKNDEKSVEIKLNYTCGGENTDLEITARA